MSLLFLSGMKIYIKNMVCDRCKMVVDNELKLIGLHPSSVELGEVEIVEDISPGQKIDLARRLQGLGFELLDDKRSRLVEKIKNKLVDLVQNKNGELKVNLSDFLSGELHHEYSYLSNLFSEETGSTIEKYFIAQKIEKVKEWLAYDELSLSEIAFRLNYSSASHLSQQFKKVTGLSPSHFKKIGENRRKPLDSI
ncbi:MAG: AraC family transcriptional regulator [Bacteroidales bacterium 45-6]|nr:MAG: AraC family transcriptional regulator [Bacteroidales bacterium 45-6]